MANDAPPLAAVLCEDLARGYRAPDQIARARHCTEHDVHLVRRLFGHDRATLARAAALLRMPPPEPAPAPPPQRTNPDADPALLADIADAAARVAQAKADRNAAIVAARASGHHIRAIAAAAHLAFSSVRHVIERGES